MTLADRAESFKATYAKWPASWPWLAVERSRPVLYAVWVLGNDYRNRSRFYGAYPPGFVDRVMALFPDADGNVLHAFSGSLPSGNYARLDINPALGGNVAGSVYDAPRLFPYRPFTLVVADPPYSKADAKRYGTPPVDRRRAVAALGDVTTAGGHLAWLDTCWPMHSKREWVTVGRILVQRSTNHRARVLSLFERVA